MIGACDVISLIVHHIGAVEHRTGGRHECHQYDVAVNRHRVLSTDGVELALHELGGTGPDLVICHATGFHGLAYEPFARRLTGDYTVWAIDLRGHGASTAPVSEDFAWKGMAEDLQACVDHMGCSTVFAVGHSMGGAAILLAELANPGMITAAYLFEPIVFPAGFEVGATDNVMGRAARSRREVFSSRLEAGDRYASRPPLSTLDPEALAAYVEHGFVDLDDGTVRLACRAEHEARTFECETKVTADRIEGVRLPLTVGAGTVDASPNPADFAPGIVAAVPGATLIAYDGMGHFGPLEDPDRIAADVLAAFSAHR